MKRRLYSFQSLFSGALRLICELQKPVSSLRSHFEKIASVNPARSSHSLRTSPRNEAQQGPSPGEHSFTERASLDLPRRPSQWNAIGDVLPKSPQRGANALGPPVTPRTQRPRSALLQRPVSTARTSLIQGPPMVTVDSPKSPLQSAQIPEPQPIPYISSPNTTIASGLGSRPAPHVPAYAPHYYHRSPARVSGHTLGGGKGSDHNSILVYKKSSVTTIDTALANVPPPIHRAEKPHIPAKPQYRQPRPSLEPDTVANGERVSPFSTPPSSDESSTPGLRADGLDNLSAPSPATPQATSENVFSPPPVHYTVKARQIPQIAPAASKPRPAASDPREMNDPKGILESRPGLPPRRMTEKGPYQPSMTQRAETRIVSTSRVQDSRRQAAVHSAAPSMQMAREAKQSQIGFMPPPRRTGTSDSFGLSEPTKRAPSPTKRKSRHTNDASMSVVSNDSTEVNASVSSIMAYPDASLSNRRPPRIKQGAYELDTGYDTRLFDICGDCVCTTGYLTRAWDLASGHPIMNLSHGEQTKITAIAFKPGASADEEGQRLWLGTSCGDLMEVDVPSQSVVASKASVHSRREIVRIYRHQNTMWTMDDGGNLNVWFPDEDGLPNMQRDPLIRRVSKGHTFSIVVQHRLWLATGKEIRVFQPASAADTDVQLTLQPLSQSTVGEITSGAVLSDQQDRVYFGHSDGKVTIYSTQDFSCLGVINVSVYKINALAGAGDFLWAGYNTGMIYVYDTKTQPWTTKKDWHAHSDPVSSILVDRSSVWRSGFLQVASIGADNAIRLWDGMLEDDWLAENMQVHDTDYCTFQEMSALVVTWNAGAATPGNIRYEEKDTNFFRDILQEANPPDLLVFGFQELVDLEDKKLTAKSLFKGHKKKDPSEQEHVGRQYRAWRDYLVRCIEDSMPSNEPFHLLHTASLVGLFSCVFVRADLRNRIVNQSAAEVKRGMGGLHGNKGCLILRFLIDDSSICLVNCHLAAGQSSTVHRNTDVSVILDSAVLPSERNPFTLCDSYTCGGDGSMILDHEICILNGDLNYRIDTMGRDTVVKAIQAGNLAKLLERDQLLVSRRRNPLLRLRAFTECPITFAPTYKYDVGTDRYDTSEKHRAPAWCDRILYRGPGKIKQLDYRRHELRVSDHRPVSGTFKMRIKSVVPKRRAQAWQACIERFESVKEELARNAK